MIFVDTGPLLARHLPGDQYHEQASAGWQRLAGERERLFTANLVIGEAITLLARRAGASFAAQRARNWFDSKQLTILRPDEADEVQALTLLERYGDQKPTFTDCVSFVLMRRQRIRRAFTFDRHFASAGFDIWP